VKRKIIREPIVVLVGPTAIGKTELSLALARHYQGEIVSVDSMQVYRHMDIGTAKASKQERALIPHHLIDIADPNENYDAARFAADAVTAIGDIHNRGKLPLLTGGTGLYLRALLQGIFPGVPVDGKIRSELRVRLETEGCLKLHEELRILDRVSGERIHPHDSQRLLRALEIYYASGIPWSEHLAEHRAQSPEVIFAHVLQIGLTCDRDQLYQQINRRCEFMVANGLEDEVRDLLTMGYNKTIKSLGSIGYRHMLNYLDGDWSWEEMVHLLTRDTRRYAKRQYTWFAKMDELLWFQTKETENIFRLVEDWLKKQHWQR
jgi:tRNA dimethylallyltransferase